MPKGYRIKGLKITNPHKVIFPLKRNSAHPKNPPKKSYLHKWKGLVPRWVGVYMYLKKNKKKNVQILQKTWLKVQYFDVRIYVKKYTHLKKKDILISISKSCNLLTNIYKKCKRRYSYHKDEWNKLGRHFFKCIFYKTHLSNVIIFLLKSYLGV